MPIQIQAPDGSVVEFPDNTDDTTIKAVMAKNYGQKVDPATNQPPGVPAFQPPGVEGYDQKTGQVAKYSMPGSAAMGAADTATAGFGDELASVLGSAITGVPRDQVLSEIRQNQAEAKSENPGSYLTGQIAGGVAQGLATGPATASARVAGTALLPRVAAGALDAGTMGGIYGLGSGTDTSSRLAEGGKDALIGAILGGAFPVAARGASNAYNQVRNWLQAGPIAREAGSSPEALRMLGTVMDADGSLSPAGQANMAQAGKEAMLADAGPNAQAVLDTAIQRGGPGAVAARQAIDDRVARGATDLGNALDQTLGAPEGVTAARSAIREASAPARQAAYDAAYSAPIDYASEQGKALESLIRNQVPGRVIADANNLMRLEGNQSRQILARVADDGSVTFERLPDVRQIDYITRALNQAAQSGEGQGALGGQTPLGRAYQGLSNQIRTGLRDLVPEYGSALDAAADPIRRSQAVELGSKLLSPSMTRDQVAQAVGGMSQAERDSLAQGIRSRIDDAMANVSRTVQDGDTGAREAIKSIKDLSSRANREKLALAIGQDQADALLNEVDRVAMSFNLRASVAQNSKTYARQAVDRRIQDMTQPGVIGTAMQGKPVNAVQRIVQALTGQTPEAIRGKQDAVYSELADLLTRRGGAGQNVYDAVGKIGKTDAATKVMMDRIVNALSGTKLSYPATTLAGNMLPSLVGRSQPAR